MKIALAQTRPFVGDIEKNVELHCRFVLEAVRGEAQAIVFPELSLTGYEPKLAQRLGVTSNDPRLKPLQKLCDAHSIVICAGVPTRASQKVHISALVFRPNEATQVYSKMFLHADELPTFEPGTSYNGRVGGANGFALAICYELSVPQHTELALGSETSAFVASVAKSQSGVDQAMKILSHIAQVHSIPVFMVNSVGPSDDFVADGRSAIWNSQGKLVVQMNSADQGLIVYDSTGTDHPEHILSI